MPYIRRREKFSVHIPESVDFRTCLERIEFTLNTSIGEKRWDLVADSDTRRISATPLCVFGEYKLHVTLGHPWESTSADLLRRLDNLIDAY